jgi:hypothetical protein
LSWWLVWVVRSRKAGPDPFPWGRGQRGRRRRGAGRRPGSVSETRGAFLSREHLREGDFDVNALPYPLSGEVQRLFHPSARTIRMPAPFHPRTPPGHRGHGLLTAFPPPGPAEPSRVHPRRPRGGSERRTVRPLRPPQLGQRRLGAAFSRSVAPEPADRPGDLRPREPDRRSGGVGRRGGRGRQAQKQRNGWRHGKLLTCWAAACVRSEAANRFTGKPSTTAVSWWSPP